MEVQPQQSHRQYSPPITWQSPPTTKHPTNNSTETLLESISIPNHQSPFCRTSSTCSRPPYVTFPPHPAPSYLNAAPAPRPAPPAPPPPSAIGHYGRGSSQTSPRAYRTIHLSIHHGDSPSTPCLKTVCRSCTRTGRARSFSLRHICEAGACCAARDSRFRAFGLQGESSCP